MQFYKSLNTSIFSTGRYTSVFMTFFVTLMCYSLQMTYTEAKTTSTTAAGAWADATKWSAGLPADGDVVIINHVMDFTNVNINIGANTTYTFAPGSNGSSIPLSLGMSSSTAVLNINANVSFAGGINLNGGTINVYEGATLTVTNQINQAGTKINVEAGGNFNVTGSYINNGGDIHVDGLVTISGTYDGQNATATVTGSGDITTTGHMKGLNGSTIFGIINPDCGGPCSGRNLCGRTVSSLPRAATYCTSGAAVVLTASFSAGSSPTYQWQSSLTNTEAGFSNILVNGNSNTYSATPGVTTYYRVKITIGGCTSVTPVSLVTVSSCSKIWVGGTTDSLTYWFVSSNWSPAGAPKATDDVIIPNVTYKPVLTGSRSAKSITINANSSLTLAANSTLNSYGNIVNNGTFTSVPTATVIFKGSTLQTIYGIPSLHKVTVDNTQGISILTALTVNGTLTLTNGAVATNSNLTLNFDNGGNIAYNAADAGSITGEITGRRDGLVRTHYIASPFSSSTSGQVGATTPLYYNNYWKMYSRDFTTQGWVAVTNTTTPLTQGTGFSVAFSNTSSLILTGSYSHTFTLPATNYSNAAAGKYILIGNPYPSTLDWTSVGFTKTNVGGAIYLWSGASSQTSSWVANVGTGPNGSQYIGPMQAFLVATTGTGGNSSVAINNTARLSTQNPSYARVASDEIVRIKITTENPDLWDDAVVRFNENATSEFDAEFDAYKIINQGFVPSVYTTSGTNNYSIHSVSDAAALPTIPVTVKLPSDGNYTLSVSKSDPSVEYVLIDKKLGTENLLSGPSYVFSGLVSDDANRFELQLRTSVTTGTHTANAASGLQIHSSSKGFVIQTSQFNGSTANIEILDVTGKVVKVLPGKNISDNTTFIPLDLAEGAYIVKVNIDHNVFAQMISLVK
jgi:hypothetical protein